MKQPKYDPYALGYIVMISEVTGGGRNIVRRPILPKEEEDRRMQRFQQACVRMVIAHEEVKKAAQKGVI